MSRISIVTIALLVLAGCTTAPPESDSAAAAATDAQASERTTTNRRRNTDDPELICRTERVIGSRLPQRVCATQREWDAMREGSQETTREIQQRPTLEVERGG